MSYFDLQQIVRKFSLCWRCPHGAGVTDGRLTCGKDGGEVRAFDSGYDCPDDRWGRQAPADLACVHRGNLVDEVECQTCNGRTMAKIYGCRIHIRCTMFAKPLDGVKACDGCKSRLSPPK